MVKKIILLVSVGVFVLAGVIGTIAVLNNIRESKESLLRIDGETFAKIVASSYFGWYEENLPVLISSKVSTPSIFEAYEQHYQSLVALNDQMFNVSEYLKSFDDEIESAPDEYSFVDNSEELSESEETYVPSSIMDSRIVKQGEDYLVPVNSLVFNEEGWDILLYEGSEYAIYSDVVPVTFDMMKKNIDYRYNYKDSHLTIDRKGNGFFDASFTSTLSKSPLLVRIRISDYKFVTFEVRK